MRLFRKLSFTGCRRPNEAASSILRLPKISSIILILFFATNTLLWYRLSSDSYPTLMGLYRVNQRTAGKLDLVLFTSFEAVERRRFVHNNTKYNWQSLGYNIKTVLFTNDSDVAKEFLKSKWDILPLLHVSSSGTPVLKSMFIEVKMRFNASFIGFANSDLLFTDTLVTTLESLTDIFRQPNRTHIIITGRRTNIYNITQDQTKAFDFLHRATTIKGKLSHGDTEDYFITDWNYPWDLIPDVVIGRPAYDNFLLLFSRMKGYVTIDASHTILALHQVVDKGYLIEKWNSTRHEKMYNVYVVFGIYRNVNFLAGRTDCLTYESRWVRKRFYVFKRKQLPRYCEFFTDLIVNQKKYLEQFYSKHKGMLIERN